jgi:hypothetical protein
MSMVIRVRVSGNTMPRKYLVCDELSVTSDAELRPRSPFVVADLSSSGLLLSEPTKWQMIWSVYTGHSCNYFWSTPKHVNLGMM